MDCEDVLLMFIEGKSAPVGVFYEVHSNTSQVELYKFLMPSDDFIDFLSRKYKLGVF